MRHNVVAVVHKVLQGRWLHKRRDNVFVNVTTHNAPDFIVGGVGFDV
jgi:hypothetical protein